VQKLKQKLPELKGLGAESKKEDDTSKKGESKEADGSKRGDKVIGKAARSGRTPRAKKAKATEKRRKV
jgi:hypothetical protein